MGEYLIDYDYKYILLYELQGLGLGLKLVSSLYLFPLPFLPTMTLCLGLNRVKNRVNK